MRRLRGRLGRRLLCLGIFVLWRRAGADASCAGPWVHDRDLCPDDEALHALALVTAELSATSRVHVRISAGTEKRGADTDS